MKFRAKHRRLFYVPGMISLVLIPVLCLWFIKSNRYQLHRDYSVNFSISDSITDVKPKTIYIQPSNGYVPKRNYQNFLFNGIDDDSKIKLAILEIKKLVKTNDTIKGIKFSFGNHANYETFISAQDIMFINRVDNYTVFENNIYIFEMPKPKQKNKDTFKPISFGHCLVGTNSWENQEWKNKLAFCTQNIKRFWQIAIGLTGLIILNLFVLIKFNRNRIYNQKTYI